MAEIIILCVCGLLWFSNWLGRKASSMDNPQNNVYVSFWWFFMFVSNIVNFGVWVGSVVYQHSLSEWALLYFSGNAVIVLMVLVALIADDFNEFVIELLHSQRRMEIVAEFVVIVALLPLLILLYLMLYLPESEEYT